MQFAIQLHTRKSRRFIVYIEGFTGYTFQNLYEPVHVISNNVVCATGKDQPAHTGSMIRAFASRLSIL